MFSQELLQQFKNKIDSASTIAIFSHESVDGDAIACLMWLGRICEKLGKNVWLFTTLPVSRSYLFLPWIEKIRTDFDYSDTRDLIVFVDFTGYNRIGKITEWHEAYFDNKDTLIVDHHIGDQTGPKATLLKDVDACSCAELIYEICNQVYPELLDADIATFLYLGLVTDSWNFQFEQDTVRTMGNAIALIKLWARKPWLVEKLFNNSEWSSIDLLKRLIPRIMHDGNICYIWYSTQEIEDLGFDKDETDILLLSIMKPIKNIWVFAILRDGSEWRVGISLRSWYLPNEKRINVQQIAVTLGGGWHMYAAGCKQPREWIFEEQVKEIVSRINTEINKQL